jgi:hypothetical protein
MANGMLPGMWGRMLWRILGAVMVGCLTGVAPRAQAQAGGEAAPAAGPTLPVAPPATATPPPAPAAAVTPTSASGAVHLRNGGFVRGELIELQPGTLVRLKLADGTVRDIPWADVDHVQDPSLPPPAPGAATPASTAGTSAGLLPMEVANADEIRRLRMERDEISNTAPAVMMILGGGAFLLLGLPGMLVLSVGESCNDDYDDDTYTNRDCDDIRSTGIVMTVVGVIGGGVAVWGLIKSGQNRRRRTELNNRVRELKGEQISLTLDVLPRANGGGLGLTLRM